MKTVTIDLAEGSAGNIYADAGTPIEELQDRLLDLQEQAQTIQAKVDAEKRDLNEEEQAELDTIFATFEETEAQIERRQRIAAQAKKLQESVGRQTEPNQPHAQGGVPERAPRQPRIQMPEDRGRWGFRNFGEFATCVRAAVRGSVDPRLIANAPTTVSTEGIGADGGFAVPPDFREAIMEAVMGEASLLGRTDQLTTASNQITLPKDETTPWQTTGGVQAYWEGEGLQLTQSKLALESTTVRLNKLTALVPVTEELMEDAPTLDGYLRRKVPEKFDFAVNLALIQGNGVGRPLGILNSGALVTVAKETSQVADTVVAENVIKMYSRMYGPSRLNAIWLINQDIEPQLITMNVPVKNVAGSENVGGSTVYMPAGGLSGAPYGTLFNRPVVPTQACETLGDLGDIIFADMTQYLSVVKTGGIRQDVSIHLWFDYDTAAYRFIFRIGGQPWWGSAIDPRDGTNTLSPFVALAARA